tara:strand:- start:1841 stop:11962 length:10122 start_codon:yes stop_codon:yes gene_type:complete
MTQDDKITIEELAKRLKEKYPQYQTMDDQELVDKVLSKYPEYQNVLKKKDQSEEDLLDVESGTSDVDDTGLDSSEVEQNTPVYTINGENSSKESVLESINNEEFIEGIANGDNNIDIQNDEVTAQTLIDSVNSFKKRKEEENNTPNLSLNEQVDQELLKSDPTRAVSKESLVPIFTQENKISTTDGLTHNAVNPVVNQALSEMRDVWPEQPLLNVESAFRDEELNKSVGGHNHSYHLHGMALDLTGDSAKVFLNWVNTTEQGKAWAEKWTESADGGIGVILESEGTSKEHVHVQFKKELGKPITNSQPPELPEGNMETIERKTQENQPDIADDGWVSGDAPMMSLLGMTRRDQQSKLSEIDNTYSNFNIEDVSDLYNEQELKHLRDKLESEELMVSKGRTPGMVKKRGFGITDPWWKSDEYFNELLNRPRKIIQDYLNSGWEHVGNRSYKHTETGIVISPEDSQGRNPLIANNSAIPKMIKLSRENPDYFNEINDTKIKELYKEFNPIRFNYLQQEIDTKDEGDKKELLEQQLKNEMGEFVLSKKNSILTNLEKTIPKDFNEKTIEFGKKLSLIEDWLTKQQKLINSYPKTAYGFVDTRYMSEKDIEDYNNLVKGYNEQYNGTYKNLLNEQNKLFEENPNIDTINNLSKGFNETVKYLNAVKENEVWQSHYNKIKKRQEIVDKTWNEMNWSEVPAFVLAQLGSDLTGNLLKGISSTPEQIKSIFSYENEFDWTDMVAKEVADAWETSPFNIAKPTALNNAEALGKVYSSKVNGNSVYFDDKGKIKHILNSDGLKVENGTDAYKEIVEEYNKNQESYPIEESYQWGNTLYNVMHAGGGFAIDMGLAWLTRGRAKAFGAGLKAQRYAFTGGLYGATNLRMYHGFKEEAINQGMLPGDASRFANEATAIVSAVEILTPDFGMLSPGTKKLATDKVFDALTKTTKKEAVTDIIRKNTIRNTAFYGVMEGSEEVLQSQGVEALKDNYYREYNFETEGLTRASAEEFFIGAILGGGTTFVSNRNTSRDYIESDLYKDALLTSYNNYKSKGGEADIFSYIDNMVGKNISPDKKFTNTDAKKLKDNLTNLFGELDNLVGDNQLYDNDLSKRELLNLIEARKNAEALQGSLDPVQAEMMKSRLKDYNSSMDKILKGADPIKVMSDLAIKNDDAVNNYIRGFAKSEDIPEGAKAIIRQLSGGKITTESQQKMYLTALQNDIKRLDSMDPDKMTDVDKKKLTLYKRIEKDISNLKVKKDETTTTTATGTEAGRTARGTEGEGIGEDTEQVATESEKTTLNQNIGKRVSYKGKRGILGKDKNGNFIIKPEGKGRGIKIKGVKRGNMRMGTVGLKYEGANVGVDSNNKLTIDGQDSGEIVGLYKDDSGSLGGVITIDDNVGDLIVDKDKTISKLKRLQKRRNEGKISQREFLNKVNEIQGLNVLTDSDVKFNAAATKLTNDIVNQGGIDVITMEDVEQMIEEAISELGQEYETKSQKSKQEKSNQSKRDKKENIKDDKRSTKPLFDSREGTDIDSLIEEYDKLEGAEYKAKARILRQAKNLFQSQGQNIIIHQDTASEVEYFINQGKSPTEAMYLAMGGNGFNLESGLGNEATMHVNFELANDNTLFHEAAHPFVTSIFEAAKQGNKNAKKLVDSIETTLPKEYLDFGYNPRAGYAKNKDGKVPLDKNGNVDRKKVTNKYDSNGPLAEALAEFLADAGLKKFDDNQSNLNKAISYAKSTINSILGIETDNPVNISLEELSNLTNIDDVAQIFKESTSRGMTVNEKARGEVKPTIKKQVDNSTPGEVIAENVTITSVDSDIGQNVSPTSVDNVERTFEEGDVIRADRGDYEGQTFTVIAADKALTGLVKSPTGLEMEFKGGMYFPYAFKGYAWAVDGTQVGTKLINAAKKTDGRVAIMIQADAGINGSLLMSQYIINEFQNVIDNKIASKKDVLEFINGKLNNTKIRSAIDKRNLLGKRKGIKSLDEIIPIFEKLDFGSRAKFVQQIVKAKDSTLSKFNLPGENKILEYVNDPDLKGVRKASVVSMVQIDVNDPNVIVDTKSSDYDGPIHESYRYLVKGSPIAVLNKSIPIEELVEEYKKDQYYKQGKYDTNLTLYSAGRQMPEVKFQTYGDDGFSSLDSSLEFTDIISGTPKQWIKEIKRVGDRNTLNELKFIGMRDFLKSVERSYADGLIPKAAIQDYISMNNTSIDIEENTMRISNPMFELSNVNFEDITNEDGERVLLIRDIKAPNREMMSNTPPTIRTLIKFASDNNYDTIAFENGSSFKGAKSEFFDSVVPEVMNDIISDINPSQGIVLTDVDNNGYVSIDITNSITSLSEDMSNPSSKAQVFDNKDKLFYTTNPKFQKFNRINSFKEFLNREVLPKGNIPESVFEMGVQAKSNIDAEKFELKKLIDRFRNIVERNQKGENPISLKEINDALTDPTAKIKSLNSELSMYESDLETLDRGGKSYAAGIVLEKIRNVEKTIKQLKDGHAGRATIKDLDSDPELQDLVKKVRRKIDSLSNKLKSVVTDGLGVVIDDNLGIYINRQYRIFNDTEYRDKMRNLIESMINEKVSTGKIKESIEGFEKEYNIIQSAMNLFSEKYKQYLQNQGLPSDEITEEKVLRFVSQLFLDNDSRDDFVKSVLKTRNINTNIFTTRKEIPDAIKDLYSPIENPVYNITNSITKMVDEYENLNFKAKTVEALNGILIFDDSNIPVGSDGDRYRNNKFTLKFNNKTYYTTKEIKEFIEGEELNYGKIMTLAQGLNGVLKLGKTVWSPKTHVRNFFGNMYFASINGHVPGSNFFESWKVMQNLFDSSTTQEREDMFATMIRAGIIDSVYADELKAILKESNLGKLGSELFENNVDVDAIKKKKPGLRKILNDFVNKAYLFEDVVWKGAGFLNEVQVYLDAGYTREQALKEASENIRGGYTTYSMVPKVGKRLRRSLFVSDFVSFPAEVVRTSVNAILIAKKQLMSGNPVLMTQGAKRLFGIGFAGYAMPHAFTLLAGTWATALEFIKNLFDDEPEEGENELMNWKLMNGKQDKVGGWEFFESLSDYYEVKKFDDWEKTGLDDMDRDKMIQLFLPPWMKYGDVKLVSAQSNENGDFDGTMYVWNSTDNMSDGIFREFVNSIFNPPEDDPSFDTKIFNDVLHTTLDPFISPSMMTQLILETGRNKKKSGASIWDEDDIGRDKFTKWLSYTLKAGAPGFATQVYDLLESWQPDTFLSEDELKYMKKSFLHEAMSFTGNRFSRFNIQENFKYGVKEVITNLNNTKPREKEEVNVFNRVKRQMEYLDKLYLYSEFFGIETEGVKKALIKSMEDKFNRSETNRDNIILQYYPGYNSNDELYMFLNRDRVSQPDFETWSKSNDWAEILKPWQTEQVQDIREKELSN